MRIEALSVFPEMFDAVMTTSILGRAQRAGLFEFCAHDLRDWTHDRHRTTDDAPYGGGQGLVMKCEPVFELPGTPVALVRTADTLLVPENVDGGWNVACYVIGGHSSGITYVVDAEGNPAGGSGEIESVELDGTTLRVTAGGTTTDVALA